MELFERLLHLVELLEGNSQTKFAQRISATQQTFNSYLNSGGQQKIKKTLLDKILVVYPEISRDWLFFGEGEPFSSTKHSAATSTPQAQQPTAPLPLLGFAACSVLGWHGTMSIPVSVEPPTWHEGMIAVMASGESMLPAGIGHGQVCYCDPSKEPGLGEAVYVETADDLGAIKLFLGRSVVGSGRAFVKLQGWLDKKPEEPLQKQFCLEVAEEQVRRIAPVIYVRRRL